MGSRDAAGALELQEAAGVLVVDEVALDGQKLTATGRWLSGVAPAEVRIRLIGPAHSVDGTLQTARDGSVHLCFHLVADPWGLGETPVPNGHYWLTVTSGVRSSRALLGDPAVDRLHHFMVGTAYGARLVRDGRNCGVELVRPLAADERGPYAQARLQDWFRDGPIPLDECAVYFQSYIGGGDGQPSSRSTRNYGAIARTSLFTGAWRAPRRGFRRAEYRLINSSDWYGVLASANYLCSTSTPERWFTRPGPAPRPDLPRVSLQGHGLDLWRSKNHGPTGSSCSWRTRPATGRWR